MCSTYFATILAPSILLRIHYHSHCLISLLEAVEITLCDQEKKYGNDCKIISWFGKNITELRCHNLWLAR